LNKLSRDPLSFDQIHRWPPIKGPLVSFTTNSIPEAAALRHSLLATQFIKNQSVKAAALIVEIEILL
jgi:hypothetical protein